MEPVLVMSQNIAVILVAVPVIETINQRLTEFVWTKRVTTGILFILIGMVVMLNPVEFIDGFRADPRTAVIAIATAFYGPACSIITAAGLIAQRLFYGGAGAFPGIITTAGLVVVSLALWNWAFRPTQVITRYYLLMQAAAAAAVPAAIGPFVADLAWSIRLTGQALLMPTSFVAVALTGSILLRSRDRDRALLNQRDKQAQLDNIAENAPTILFEIDLDEEDEPRFIYVSGASMQMLGRSPEVLLKNFGAFEAMLPVASQTGIRSLIRRSAEAGASWAYETKATRADQVILWLRITANSRLNAEGEIVWDGTIADTTEEKNLELKKNDFIAVVSHELKTPVTAIRGSLSLLSSAAVGEPNPRITHLITIAERNAERLTLLVNDILEMQQLSTERLRLNVVAHAIRPLLELSVETARGRAAKRDVEVILDDDVPDAVIDIDSERLEQVLANLLSNAIKFSHAGSVVIVSCAAADDWLRISVWDNGPGIPIEFHSRVFDAFTQAEPPGTRSADGMGLGLKITKTLVDELGGRIYFDTAAGRGTTFHVDMPYSGHQANDVTDIAGEQDFPA